MTYRISLATSAAQPDTDDRGQEILSALRAAGHEAEAAVWTDSAVDWEQFDAVVLDSREHYSLIQLQQPPVIARA